MTTCGVHGCLATRIALQHPQAPVEARPHQVFLMLGPGRHDMAWLEQRVRHAWLLACFRDFQGVNFQSYWPLCPSPNLLLHQIHHAGVVMQGKVCSLPSPPGTTIPWLPCRLSNRQSQWRTIWYAFCLFPFSLGHIT